MDLIGPFYHWLIADLWGLDKSLVTSLIQDGDNVGIVSLRCMDNSPEQVRHNIHKVTVAYFITKWDLLIAPQNILLSRILNCLILFFFHLKLELLTQFFVYEVKKYLKY